MKKLISLILVFTVVVVSTTAVFGVEQTQEPTMESLHELSYEEKLDRIEWHDLSELDSIRKEDTYTYDEYILYLKSNGFTDEEVLDFIGERPIETRGSVVRFAPFSMKVFTYKEQVPTNYKLYKVQAKISVGLEYLGNSSTPYKIAALKSPMLYTSIKGGDTCSFDGSIEYELTAGNEFYYCFYGSLYERGKTTWSVGVNIGIGESSIVSANFSNGDGFITDVYEGETYHSDTLAS